jgi:predicted metal-dependent hydrolase
MPGSLSSTWSSVGSRRLATHPDLPVPVLLCAIRSARRIRLRLDERDRLLKVTHPRAVGSSAALAWAASQKDWVVEQLDRVLPAAPFVPGAIVPLDGEEIELCWSEYCPRVPRLIAGKLICGGPPESFARRVELFLRRLALDRLSEETAALARGGGAAAAAAGSAIAGG